MLFKLVKTTKTNEEGKKKTYFYMQLENGHLVPIEIRTIKVNEVVRNPHDFALALMIAEELPKKETK